MQYRGLFIVDKLTRLLEEHDVVIIGGGVAGYVAAIKAGQEGLKVKMSDLFAIQHVLILHRWPV